MNTIGAMNSPVKQPLPTSVLTPSITNNSQLKVQNPPSVTPLNLNTAAQSSQPLSLVNENKNINNGNQTPLSSSNESPTKKSVPCNGVSEIKPVEKKVEEVVPKPEQPILTSQLNSLAENKNSNVPTTSLKIQNPTSTTTDTVTTVENLSKKTEEKVSSSDKVENELPPVETPTSEPVKIEEKIKPVDVKQNENESQVNKEPIEVPTIVKSDKECHDSKNATETLEKSDHSSPTKVAGVKRKKELKVNYILKNKIYLHK